MTTNLRGNPIAEALETYADPRNSLEAAATLALAYEQRTASLIAWTTSGGAEPSREVAIDIAKRLGLGK